MPLPWLSAPLAAIAIFAVLLVWPGRFLLLDYMMDDWIFGWEVVHRSRPGFDARLEGFAQELAQVLRNGGYDEVVFAAHSLGCALKIAVVDRALQLVPDFGKDGDDAVAAVHRLVAAQDRLSSQGRLDARGGGAGIRQSVDFLDRLPDHGRPDQLL